jgi:lipopolysaccharide transport protein LptA
MTSWQRRLRAGIGIFGIGFAILVFFALRQPKPGPSGPSGVSRVDPKAAVESTAGQILRLRGDKEDVVIEYARLLSYQTGRDKLMGVRILLKHRQGRDVTITADEAEVAGKDESHVNLTGNVVVTATDGSKLTAPAAVYDKPSGMVTADGKVTFAKGRMSGASVGMTYHQSPELLDLRSNATIHIDAEKPGDPPLDIRAGHAVYPRDEANMRFEGGFTLTNGARILSSDAATAFLTDDEQHVQFLDMRGHSSVTGTGDGAGTFKDMSAQDINLEFADDGRTISGAALSRDAGITMAGEPGKAGRRITGSTITLAVGPDGSTLTSLTAREKVRLDLPREGAEPARTITAASLVSSGEPGKGLSKAVFSGGVEYTEKRTDEKGKPAPPRIARSRSLDLAVGEGFGTVNDAAFSGAVRFEQEQIKASGGNGRYGAKAGVLDLDGIDDTTGQGPRVSDDQVTIDAPNITLTLEGRKIVARKGVRSTMRPAPAGGGGTAAKRPSMMKSDQPVYAAAENLDYDGASRLAVYEGGARLWQGDTAIQGDRVTLDDATGNLTARGHVKSTFMLEQQDDKTKKTERVTTIGNAKDLVYEEATRKATYTTDARVSGPQGDLRATKIELYLKPSGNELDRAEAYEKVTLRGEGRVATGNRLTYFAADEKYLMQGTPVKIVADCRETEGRLLTFYKAVDTISVDGDDEIRTKTKGGPACGGPRK